MHSLHIHTYTQSTSLRLTNPPTRASHSRADQRALSQRPAPSQPTTARTPTPKHRGVFALFHAVRRRQGWCYCRFGMTAYVSCMRPGISC
ncbi:uncharacterized protein K452DRAFT_93384 [Aplosporella prunicola CBS 121167]|uniref:Uncharacterized protein n=1 Tax=Aplosporella prunicola CBS 121167 TaxID=1176127 RepID=A0A6A6B2Z7_9PEZI|nr:uncharacterized protein K452DRAFT_93384 [Aplosporella prunicola CBS 121167]KAF2137968.1 hypothetical protein K452DRAFT_93384 [Aplosporella prunicola CBS 121167]